MKPRKRRKFDREEWVEARLVFRGSRCRIDGCDEPFTDLHHILPRDGAGTWPSGDDDLRNLVPLCRFHHEHVEMGTGHAREALKLVKANYEYLAERIGERWLVFLERHYRKQDT